MVTSVPVRSATCLLAALVLDDRDVDVDETPAAADDSEGEQQNA